MSAVGDATVQSVVKDAGQGFYAVAYTLGSETIISYRGTDNPNPLSSGSDFGYGWSVGVGFNVGQAPLSIQFHEAQLGDREREIVNRTVGGILWGDYAAGVNAEGERADDASANSDLFYYHPDTTIMDAQHYDLLTFYGIPMTGGDAAASIVGLALELRKRLFPDVEPAFGAPCHGPRLVAWPTHEFGISIGKHGEFGKADPSCGCRRGPFTGARYRELWKASAPSGVCRSGSWRLTMQVPRCSVIAAITMSKATQ